METIVSLVLIQFIIVNITDLSGVVYHIESAIAKWLHTRKVSLKILECSYCQTHWIGLIYLICTGFTLEMYAFLLLICFLTPVTQDIVRLIRDMLTVFINFISKHTVE